MYKKNEHIRDFTILIIYGIIGGVLRYLIILSSNSGLKNLYDVGRIDAIILLISVVGLVLYAFLTKKQLPRVVQGAVTGLSVGFSLVTVYALWH